MFIYVNGFRMFSSIFASNPCPGSLKIAAKRTLADTSPRHFVKYNFTLYKSTRPQACWSHAIPFLVLLTRFRCRNARCFWFLRAGRAAV
jgi:hypothetical protein